MEGVESIPPLAEQNSAAITTSSSDGTELPPLIQDLPECDIEGCSKKVYFDLRLPENLRVFQYCSPECRDKILEEKNEQLRCDIQEMEVKLKSLTVPSFDTKPTKKSSSEREAVASGSMKPASSSSTASSKHGTACVSLLTPNSF